MSNIHDPKNFDKRILTGAGADHAAAQMVRNQQSNPLFPIVERMRGDMGRLMQQSKSTAIRLNAVMDYLGYLGVFLTQEMDEEGFPGGPTKTPKDAEFKLFDILYDKGIISDWPEYGFDAFFIEHHKLSDVVMLIGQARAQGTSMKEIIETVREFNAEPRRITKIRGEQIGLVEYLNENPDNLSEEEITNLASEFNLQAYVKEDDKDENTDQGEENETAEEVQAGADSSQS